MMLKGMMTSAMIAMLQIADAFREAFVREEGVIDFPGTEVHGRSERIIA